jgi:hypothetical protein
MRVLFTSSLPVACLISLQLDHYIADPISGQDYSLPFQQLLPNLDSSHFVRWKFAKAKLLGSFVPLLYVIVPVFLIV